jgi:hypothetical protein
MGCRINRLTFGVLGAVMLLAGLSARPALAQSSSANQERWLHVRVDSTDAKGDTVRVNVPLSLAEAVLSNFDHDRIHHGRISVGHEDFNGTDLRAMVQAIKNARDGEFVTVQSRDQDVRVAKQDGTLLVHVTDKSRYHDSQNVDVKLPMNVVDALLAPGNDELDVVAAIKALGAHGDTEIVNVKDGQNTVRVWLDTKNSAD